MTNDLTTTELDPKNLALLTHRCVDQIGSAAADEIERAAQAIEDEAHAKAEKLRRFAAVVREQTIVAAGDIADFSARALTVLDTIMGLEAKVTPPARNGNGAAHE